jgi:heme exporter protein B
LQESRGRMLYYQSIVNAQHFVLAKLLFNSILMLLMSGVSLFLFMLFFGNPLLRTLPFVGVALLGGWSLSLVFSFLAAIAAKAQQNAAIMAILGFPLIIPQLLMLMQVSNAFFTTQPVPVGTTVILLCVIDLFVVVLSTILFPFLWKD